MSLATREALWLRLLMADLGYGDLSAETYGDLCEVDYRRVRLSSTVDPFETALALQGDNKAALQMSKNPVHHKRSKHIHVAFGLTREAVHDKFVAPVYISTDENIADLMTKELKLVVHNRHSSLLIVDSRDGRLLDVTGVLLTLGDHVIKRAAAHSGALFSIVGQNGTSSFPCACLDARFAIYAKNGLVNSVGCQSGLRKTPCMGRPCIWAISSQAGHWAVALASRAQCAICPDL